MKLVWGEFGVILGSPFFIPWSSNCFRLNAHVWLCYSVSIHFSSISSNWHSKDGSSLLTEMANCCILAIFGVYLWVNGSSLRPVTVGQRRAPHSLIDIWIWGRQPENLPNSDAMNLMFQTWNFAFSLFAVWGSLHPNQRVIFDEKTIHMRVFPSTQYS